MSNQGIARMLKQSDQTKWEIAFDQNPSPDIFKLHAIICSELLDYLSLKDIHSLGQTCKRFNRIAGIYFQENYWDTVTQVDGEEITCHVEPVSAFKKFIQQIRIPYMDDALNTLKYVTANGTSLMKIFIYFIGEKDIEFDCIKETLTKIEHIELYEWEQMELYDKFLKYCPNLKILIIGLVDLKIEDRAWLHQRYARLEYVSIRQWKGRIPEMQIFLEQNSKIRSFSINHSFLAENEDWLLTTNANLDYLGIGIYDIISPRLISLLRTLHERKFYKKLRFSIRALNQDLINQIGGMPAVERLWFYEIERNFDFPVMADVKELRLILLEDSNLNSEEFFTKFPNVQRMRMNGLTFDQLLTIFKRCKHLKDLQYYERHTLNLAHYRTLNEERGKVFGASKVRIYLINYLAAKWTFNGTELDLIEIKPSTSWRHKHFDNAWDEL